MNILKEKVDVTNESKMRFHQLQIAHNSTIMVYAKVDILGHGLVKEIARKLRPEFGRFFLTTEVRDCIKLIERHNGDESIPGIDLIIMDTDHNSIKFLDMINKRPHTKATASLPLISTVMILPEAATGGHLQSGLTPKDARSQILDMGGASHICDHKTTTQEVFYCVLGSLSHRKTVESAFRDLKAAKIKAAKYPFLPIFTKKISLDEEENSDTDDDFAGFDEEGKAEGDTFRDQHSLDGSSTSLKELDDWTDSSSMLPEFVRSSRHKVIQGIKNRHSAPKLEAKEEGKKESMTIPDRQAADKNIVKFLNTGEPLERMPRGDDSARGTPRRNRSDSRRSSGVASSVSSQPGSPKSSKKSPLLGTPGAEVRAGVGGDGEEKKEDGKAEPENKHHSAALAAAAANAAGGRGRGARAKLAAPSPLMPKKEGEGKAEEEEKDEEKDEEEEEAPVGPSHDPQDDVSALDGPIDDLSVASGSVVSASEMPSLSSPSSRGHKRGGILFAGKQQDSDLLLYLSEPEQRPTFHKRSIFKMNKIKAAKAATGGGGGGGGDGGDSVTSEPSAVSTSGNGNSLEPFISKDVPDMSVLHSVGGLDKHQAIEQWRIIGASHYDVDQMKGGHVLDDTHHAEEENRGAEPRTSKFQSAKGTDKISAVEKRKAAVDPTLSINATRSLKRMARDTAPDVQLNNLIPLELTHGKVTVGDRDLLEAGQKAEAEGLYEVAVTMYKRAGLHTNKPHLSQLFLARTHYHLGKYMMALDHLNSAIEFQEKIRHLAIFSADDHFIGHFNRALVHFRLGDDEKGILDLEEAIRLNPDDIRAKTVYPVALRRMGRYSEAIESSKQNSLMKKENERRAREEEAIRKEKHRLRKLQAKKRRALEASTSLELSLNNRSMMSAGSGKGGGDSGSRGGARYGVGRPGSSSQQLGSAHSRSHAQSMDASQDDATTVGGSQVLTVHCTLEDKGGGTFNSRKSQREKQLMKEGSSTGQVGEALRVFKLTNGFRDNLFEELFTEPTELQKSLVVPPNDRSSTDIETIKTYLRLFPFLRPLESSDMSELAQAVEYRAVHNRVEQSVYAQNDAAGGVILLLRGGLQGRLETNDSSAGKLVVDDVEPYQAAGYIDSLFSDSLNPIIRELYRDIKQSRDARASAADTIMLEDGSQPAKPESGGPPGMGMGATGAGAGDGPGGLSTRSSFLSHGGTGSGSNLHHSQMPGSPKAAIQEDLEPLPDKLPRPIQAGMFITYSFSHRLTELLIINKDTFSKLLYPIAAAEFKRRVESVEGCAVFKGWQKEDLVRLARMGRVRTYRSGDLILKQGTKPDYLSLIMKGMCKSYKAPNKSTVLSAKLAQANEKAEKHDLKYCYDSKLRNTLSRGQLEVHPKTSERRRRSLMAKSHVTVSEAIRYSLGVEIKLLEKELAKAIEAEELNALEELSMDEAKESVTSKLSEVSTLQWPQLFGESCVIDPESGTSHGTIVADTTLEVLCIHKSQLQTFRIKEDLLDRIKYRSVCYPEDEELLAQKERQEAWELQRVHIVKNLSTPKEEYLEPFYV